MDDEQDYGTNAQRLNAFCERYVRKLEEQLEYEEDEETREKLREKVISVRCLTIPLIGQS